MLNYDDMKKAFSEAGLSDEQIQEYIDTMQDGSDWLNFYFSTYKEVTDDAILYFWGDTEC